MNTTKEALAPLIYQIALDEKMIFNVEEARELERKLRAFDHASFEHVLQRRAASLRAKSLPESNAPFTADFYSEQANSIDSLIATLPAILA